MRNKKDNNNKDDKKDDDGMKIDRKKLEQESHQEIVNIIEATTREIKKEWEKISGHERLKKNYEDTMNSLPGLLNICDQLEKNWNLKSFLEKPEVYINQFKIKTHRIDSNISVNYKVEDLITIHHLNMYIMGHISQFITDIAGLVSYLEIIQPNYDENSHMKHIIGALILGFSRIITKFSYLFRLISHYDSRAMDPHKVLKYPLIEDLKTLTDTYLYTNTYSSIVAVKTFKHYTYTLYNFLLINKDNWKAVFDYLSNL